MLSHPTDPDLAIITLTRGKTAIISALDADAAGRHNWIAEKSWNGFYAATNLPRGQVDKKRLLRLHVFIARRMGIAPGVFVDHRDGNGLDCRRSNLRAATESQNSYNSTKRSDNTSGAKGVSLASDKRAWIGQIQARGRHYYLGRFGSIAEARDAVASARVELHGEFANHGVG